MTEFIAELYLFITQVFPGDVITYLVIGIVGSLILWISHTTDNYTRSQTTQNNNTTRKTSRKDRDLLQEYQAAKSDSERYKAVLVLCRRHKKSTQTIRERLLELGVYVKPEKRQNKRRIDEHLDNKAIALQFIRLRAWAITSDALQKSLDGLQTSRDRLTTTKGNIGRITVQRLLRKLVGLAYEDLEIWEASYNELQAKTDTPKRTLQIGLLALQEAGLITELERDTEPDWELRFRLNVTLADDEEKMALDVLEDGYETLVTSKAA